MPWTQSLLRLQEIDLELAETAQRLAEIAELAKDDAALQQARRQAGQHRERADKSRKLQQTLEFELAQAQTKRARTEDNLYSGRITNARELQDLEAELASLKRRESALEDDLLEAMLGREEADAAADQAAGRVAALAGERGAKVAALQAEQAALESKRAALGEERAATVADLPPALVADYTYLHPRTGGLPVAQLRGGVCSICGTEVLRPTQQKVQRGQEAHCDTCRRLLVMP